VHSPSLGVRQELTVAPSTDSRVTVTPRVADVPSGFRTRTTISALFQATELELCVASDDLCAQIGDAAHMARNTRAAGKKHRRAFTTHLQGEASSAPEITARMPYWPEFPF
jgi:hypothetical protein